MDTRRACKAAEDVYALDTSQVPEQVPSDGTQVAVGCILHGEYTTRWKNIRARSSSYSPGCPECRATYRKKGPPFHILKQEQLLRNRTTDWYG